MSERDLDDLASELSEFAAPEKKGGRPPEEERVIAGFEEIQRFVQGQGRLPRHGEAQSIFERMYAARLDRIRALPEWRTVLQPLDHQGLLGTADAARSGEPLTYDVDELAAELGAAEFGEIAELRHVRPSAEKRAAEEIAQRKPCENFDEYRPLFEQVRRELNEGVRETRPVQKLDEIRLTEIQQGEFFIVEGQIVLIAEVGEDIRTKYERRDSRLRVIYDNGTESDILKRSFQRALYRDDAARLITSVSSGPLFATAIEQDDQRSGTIYVARSKSNLPVVAQFRDVLHKIGVTGQHAVSARVSGARDDPTFLLADVDVVATYNLYNIDRAKLENVIHRVFGRARLDIEIADRFGKPVVPREWFLVPLHVVDEAVSRIVDGSITGYVYDPKAVQLVKAASAEGR